MERLRVFRVESLGLGGLGFRVLGSRVEVLGFGVSGLRVQGLGSRVYRSARQVPSCSRLPVVFRVSSGFRISLYGLRNRFRA